MSRKLAARVLAIAASYGFVPITGVSSAAPASLEDSAWSRVAAPPDSSLQDPEAKRGRGVFLARCQACHGVYSQEMKPGLFRLAPMPGTLALQIKYKGSVPAALEQRTDLTRELVTYVVRHGIGPMPFFRPTELTDEDLRALGLYLTRVPR